MAKVALVRCNSYNYPEVKRAVERGLELIGGASSFLRFGESILLKPNLLAAEPPEKCVTTHPTVFRAVGECLLQEGARLCYGDSPGIGSPAAAARKSGINDAAQELGIEMADFRNGREVFYAEGTQNKKFTIANGVLDCQGLVSLPKLKTHGLTQMTGAIKNQFGCIPGLLKGEYHVKLPHLRNFAQMLVDLNCFLRPRLLVMDGIMAMEGNGPRGGRPRPMNVLLFSSDPVALDATVCRMIGLRPETIPTLEMGMKSGLGTYKQEEIEMLGDDIGQFIISGFDVKKDANTHPTELPGFLKDLLVTKPVIVEEGCVKCGICLEVCPVVPKVLAWSDDDRNKPPVYDYKRCIRCYCCQEMCPEGTIVLKVPALRRAMSWRKTTCRR